MGPGLVSRLVAPSVVQGVVSVVPGVVNKQNTVFTDRYSLSREDLNWDQQAFLIDYDDVIMISLWRHLSIIPDGPYEQNFQSGTIEYLEFIGEHFLANICSVRGMFQWRL